MTAVQGTWRLVRALVRTGWRRMLLWALLCTAAVVATYAGISGLYETPESRATYAATLGTSSYSAAFNGRGYDLLTTGGIGAYEVGFVGQLLLPVAAVLLAVRHSRSLEEVGLLDLLTAGRVGRLAPLLAGAVVTVVPLALVGDWTKLGLMALGQPSTPSIRYAGALVAMMVFFAMLGLLLGELTQSARTATMLGLGAVGAAFLVRAVVDARGSDLVWLSPLGWLPEARPWGEDTRPWPVLAYLGGSILLLALACWVRLHRDLGSGVLATRPGPARGRPGTASAVRWPLRLTRGTACAWLVATVVLGGTMGLLARQMTDLLLENPALLAGMGIDRPADLVTTMTAVLVAGLAGLCGVGAALQLRQEEDSGRLGAVLAGRPGRRSVWAGWAAVSVAEALAVLAGGLLSYGAAAAAAGSPDAWVAVRALLWAHALPVSVLVAVSLALAAWTPRLSPVAWLPVAWVMLVGMLAEPLRLPGWARDLSPVHAVGDVPVEPASGPALAAIAAITVLTVVATLAGASRRDLRAG